MNAAFTIRLACFACIGLSMAGACTWQGTKTMEQHRAVDRTFTVARADLIHPDEEFAVGEKYTVTISPSVSFEFTVTSTSDAGDGTTTVTGFTGNGERVTITYDDTSMAATIWGDHRSYEILPGEPGEVRVFEINPSMVVDGTDEIDVPVPVPPPDQGLDPARRAVVDVLFVFPNRWIEGRNVHFCHSPVAENNRAVLVAHALAVVQQVMPPSVVIQSAGHACIARTVPCRSSAMDRDCIDDEVRWVNAQAADPDSEVGKLRDSTYADLIAVFLRNSHYAGATMTLPEIRDEDVDYSQRPAVLVNEVFGQANFTFVHELGHAFGLRHDRPFYRASHPDRCDAGGGVAGMCNYGAIVFEPRADEMWVARGYTIMATSGVCACHPATDRCAARRHGAFSGQKLADNPRTPEDEESWRLGTACEDPAQYMPYDQATRAVQYLEQGAAYVEKFRTRPDNPSNP